MTTEQKFEIALYHICDISRKRGYIATYFLRMIGEYGGVQTAKLLLEKVDPQMGLTNLWELGLLKDSMEAVVLDERFCSLFTSEELSEAHSRLEKLNYFPAKS